MNYLLLDIGNSNIKAGITDKNGVIIHSVKRIAYEKKNLIPALDSLLAKYKGIKFDKVGISLVDLILKDNLISFISKNFSYK